jgi:phosphoribosyl-dephospho-CoA transferase
MHGSEDVNSFDRMRSIVHDLLRLSDPGDLVNRDPSPGWVHEALSRAPWVVVRRAPFERELIPVGVRGQSRSERFATYVHPSSIAECVSPEDLSSSQAWKKAARCEEMPALRLLPRVYRILRTTDLIWGPVGSVGFELASGVPIAHRMSDLDLIVRTSDFLIPPATTKKLLAMLQGTEVQVDLLLETMDGAISFLEYAGGGPNLLLRNLNGPCLVPHPAGETYRRVGVAALRHPREDGNST